MTFDLFTVVYTAVFIPINTESAVLLKIGYNDIMANLDSVMPLMSFLHLRLILFSFSDFFLTFLYQLPLISPLSQLRDTHFMDSFGNMAGLGPYS